MSTWHILERLVWSELTFPHRILYPPLRCRWITSPSAPQSAAYDVTGLQLCDKALRVRLQKPFAQPEKPVMPERPLELVAAWIKINEDLIVIEGSCLDIGNRGYVPGLNGSDRDHLPRE